ncbi:hypothetical protein [Kingella sp. (in: b-proteobacteria)]|uniref:hypothetical protein n=1 Tax=Kingella sp. (in: b-proteobacteria) TaxID=2020713 RepID=UPI0026DA9AF1|nr:hypothetical protein [Kingella sp. (in: b-proteobacteria)]MDO4656431.1 hypothetical protein [Kingella sp. (in: b-proteobacteria)]
MELGYWTRQPETDCDGFRLPVFLFGVVFVLCFSGCLICWDGNNYLNAGATIGSLRSEEELRS